MNLHQIIRLARKQGGLTVNAAPNVFPEQYTPIELTTGYMVSAPHGIENLPDAALTPAVLGAFIASQPNIWEIGYLGLWRDGAGRWSVDVSMHKFDQGTARMIGFLNGQRAIWDCARGEAITL